LSRRSREFLKREGYGFITPDNGNVNLIFAHSAAKQQQQQQQQH
jgi:cold shock CspA family protein